MAERASKDASNRPAGEKRRILTNGDLIRSRRESLSWSYGRLATEVSIAGRTKHGQPDDFRVTDDTISNWESGKTEPTLTLAKILGDVLGITLDELTTSPEK